MVSFPHCQQNLLGEAPSKTPIGTNSYNNQYPQKMWPKILMCPFTKRSAPLKSAIFERIKNDLLTFAWTCLVLNLRTTERKKRRKQEINVSKITPKATWTLTTALFFHIIFFSITDNMRTYSAVCWLFGKYVYEKYGIPIGLIQTAWSGTRIQAWSSPETLSVCYPDGPGYEPYLMKVLMFLLLALC